MIQRDELCSLIPHSGGMCLLDKVLHWDPTIIQCSSETHLLSQNPLCIHHQLAAVHAIEYGAQAMAVHGGLLARKHGTHPVKGFVAALKDVNLYADYLHDKPDPLQINAKALLLNSDAMIYRFRITSGGISIADGQITVMSAAGG
ncbi:phosphotransferase [Candidatus Vondammii sp. HM_W22]|uniref:phosphotransferase n=1 Tax=Candidatus Vondammii sp. HM_W22 TaxID=2687299 RepID=UPI001F143168|nr:phosphotransferase [Candidatus Vondammii sp. HM_W22]